MNTTDLRRFTCGRCGAIEEVELDSSGKAPRPAGWGDIRIDVPSHGAGDGPSLDRLLCPGCGPTVLGYAASTNDEDRAIVAAHRARDLKPLHLAAKRLLDALPNDSFTDPVFVGEVNVRAVLEERVRDTNPDSEPGLVRPKRYPEGAK